MHACLLLLASLTATGADPVVAQRIDPRGIAGSLVICGGGALPDEIVDRFMDLAGGEEARLVIVPTASGRADTNSTDSLMESWKERPHKSLTVLHTRSRTEADQPSFCAPLRTATAVWFGGGAQSRLSEAYVGTAVEQELGLLLKRGGVIGGTSAGAAIQSRLMIASGNPLPTLSQGFSFLPGCAVDQHFARRNRFGDMKRLVEAYPQLLGVGIDEGTVLLVRGSVAEVLGAGNVYFYDRRSPSPAPSSDHHTVRAGQRFDLNSGLMTE